MAETKHVFKNFHLGDSSKTFGCVVPSDSIKNTAISPTLAPIY